MEIHRLEKWGEKALLGIDDGLPERDWDPLNEELETAVKRVGELSMEVERNTQIRLLTRLAHGFKRVEALIGLSMLQLAGICPSLRGRLRPTAPS